MTADHDPAAADAALFGQLRGMWQTLDPVPPGLADRMVAAVAIEDLTREWTLLTLLDGRDLAAVRGESDTLILQFSDGTSSVMLHVSMTEDGQRRVDGWIDPPALEVRLSQGETEWGATPSEGGRFEIEGVTAGLCRLRMVIQPPEGALREVMTPQFEV
jgi:hypothetical protein